MTDLPQHWIDTPATFDSVCDRLERTAEFGFDTEFIGENSYHPRLCLLQIAVPDALFVVDPLAIGNLEQFWRLAADAGRTAVVHAGREEVRMCRQAIGQAPAKLFDLQIAAGLIGLGYPLGYGPLVGQVLERRMNKGETLTDWSRRPLTPQQVQYAFDDVRYLLPLHERLSRQVDSLGRSDWLVEETESFVRHAMADDPEMERWRKLRGIGSLDRKRLAVARELFDWRESVAERQNRPARTVIRDDLLVQIAKRMPHKERDLAVIRGVPAREHAAIIEAVQRGRETPPERWPDAAERDTDPPQIALVNSFLLAILADLCTRWSLTPGLVATSSDVKLLVRAFAQGESTPDESGLAHGWRAQYVAPILLEILRGRRALRIGDLRGRAPLAWDGIAPPPPGAAL